VTIILLVAVCNWRGCEWTEHDRPMSSMAACEAFAPTIATKTRLEAKKRHSVTFICTEKRNG
jgi:hypothetical protein